MRMIRSLLVAALLGTQGSAAQAEGPTDMSESERLQLRSEVRAYLLENPDIIVEMIAIIEEREKAQSEPALIAAHAQALFEDGFSFVGGNPEGDVTIVEFTDYQCGFCRRAHPEIRDLVASDDGIRLIVKELPILGPGSETAARAAIATLIVAGPEPYRALNAALMGVEGAVTDARLDALLGEAGVDAAEIRAQMQSDEVTRRLDETRGLAADLAIAGTPTFVVEDRLVRGYVPLETMRDLVAEVREAG